MKYILSISLILFSFFVNAQYGTATDFIVIDIEGNEHHLYQILDEGKPVVLDVSATWCGPCWNLHQTHALEDLHVNYGPGGTDQIRVLFYEGDASTDLNALMGIGPRTLGNWLEGASYPFINESPLTLDLNLYAPLGFPTVNLIRPVDREIVADMYNYSLAQMITAINEIVTLGNPTSTSNLQPVIELKTYPNPVIDRLYFDMDSPIDLQSIEVFALDGRSLMQYNFSDIEEGVDVSGLSAGQYIVRLRTLQHDDLSLKFVKF